MKAWYDGLAADERQVIDFRIRMVRSALKLPADLAAWPEEEQEGLRLYLGEYREKRDQKPLAL